MATRRRKPAKSKSRKAEGGQSEGGGQVLSATTVSPPADQTRPASEAPGPAAPGGGLAREPHQVVRPDGSVADEAALAMVETDLLVDLYRAVWRSREIDRRLSGLQRQGRIGFYGTSIGEEAAVFGSAAALESRDWVFPALRQGGVAVWRGYPLSQYVAQCIGNSLDWLQGRQMPCHYSDRSRNHVSWSSVIATQLPHAVGAAMASRYRNDGVVAAAYLGDGATSEPDFHVALNFAAVNKAPVVFICHNNQWAISVPFSQQTASDGVAIKSVAYGMPGRLVDGNDVVAVLLACREAVNRARSGGGPTLIECVTYRLLGHTTSDDPSRYRDEAEVALWRDRDPLIRQRALLEDRGLWSDQRQAELEKQTREDLDAAIAEAEAAGPPAPETLFDDVYASLTPLLGEQRQLLQHEMMEPEQ